MYYPLNNLKKISSNGKAYFTFCSSKYFWLPFLALIFGIYILLQNWSTNSNIINNKLLQIIKTNKTNNIVNNKQNLKDCIRNEKNKFVLKQKIDRSIRPTNFHNTKLKKNYIFLKLFLFFLERWKQ